VETLTIQPFLMGDVVHRIDDIIDRNDIELAAFYADSRHPLRQRVAHFLNQLEEVIRAIDLVDLTGLRMPHDHPRPIDAPWHFAFVTHDGFRVVLGAEVGMIELFGFFEHILAESAVVEARCCN